MGGMYSSPHSASGYVEVAAPAELLWDVVSDLEAAPLILSQVTSVKRKSGGRFEVGTKWRETRTFKEKEFVQHKTITAITEDPYSVSINVSYQEMNSNDLNTSTIMVERIDENSSRLLGTFAFQFSTLKGRIEGLLCGRCIIRMAQAYFQDEMEEYAAAAEKRAQGSTNLSLQESNRDQRASSGSSALTDQ